MAESLNKKADLVVPGVSYMGLNNYGKIMIGETAFEFYNDRNINDFIQIPWTEIEHIFADVHFKKKITRFSIETKTSGTYYFSASRRNKDVLRACREYFPKERMMPARTAGQNFRLGMKHWGERLKGLFKK